MKLAIANWLGARLPFRFAPAWLNYALARWVWGVPGFNIASKES